MAALVEIDDRGLASLSIAEPNGQRHAYRFRPAPAGLSRRALFLTRADTGAEYRVAQDKDGRMRCTCPAEQFRKRGAPHCKHTTAAQSLWAFLDQMENFHERPRNTNEHEHPGPGAEAQPVGGAVNGTA